MDKRETVEHWFGDRTDKTDKGKVVSTDPPDCFSLLFVNMDAKWSARNVLQIEVRMHSPRDLFKFFSCCLLSVLVPSGAPLGVNTATLNSSSIRVSWNGPEIGRRNGVILSYTVCLSLSSNDTCRVTQTTTEKVLFVSHLNSSTRYFVKVLASTKAGHGIYSEPKEQITNGSKYLSYF